MFKKSIILFLSFLILGYFSSHVNINPYPRGAYKIDPPVIFVIWYIQLQSCLERIKMPISENNNFNEIDWYMVPVMTWKSSSDGNNVFGTYFLLNKRIYFAEKYNPRRIVIKHELQHYFLRDFYDPLNEHPIPPFYNCEFR